MNDSEYRADRTEQYNRVLASEISFEDVNMGSDYDEEPLPLPHPTEYNNSKLAEAFWGIKKSIGTIVRRSPSFMQPAPPCKGDEYEAMNETERKTKSKMSMEEEEEQDSRLMITEESKEKPVETPSIKVTRPRTRSAPLVLRALTFKKVDKDVKFRPNSKWKRVKQFYNGIKFGHLYISEAKRRVNAGLFEGVE